MPDEADLAQEVNERLLADALADHQRRQPVGPGLTHCEDCDEEIPEARRQAVPGCRRCVSCQEILENWRPL
jgi:phage/conjugal plasmid C-4 type zinc finger TraR family protein